MKALCKGDENLKVVIDRFEGEIAVVLVGEESWQLSIPRKYLPEGAREGSHLVVSCEIAAAEKEEQEKRIKSLLDKLMKKNG